jgi:hypothetical protein
MHAKRLTLKEAKPQLKVSIRTQGSPQFLPGSIFFSNMKSDTADSEKLSFIPLCSWLSWMFLLCAAGLMSLMDK